MSLLHVMRERVAAAFDFVRSDPPRIGAEAEFLVLRSGDHTVASLADETLPVVREHARAEGWRERLSSKGTTRFEAEGDGSVSFEPGGQLEYASPPLAGPSELLAHLRDRIGGLRDRFGRAGLDLVAAGIDPFNDTSAAPLQVRCDRYERMDARFAAVGPAGARMMRQTASIQLNLDVACEPALTWRVLNALAPCLTAMFANSAVYAGEDTGYASFRAETWRRLDPTRTGLWYDESDPVGAYAARAMRAPRIDCDAPASEHGIDEHLTTLFPEVRPRRYVEVRSIDALEPEHYAAAVLLVSGLISDRATLLQADEALGPPDEALLSEAGHLGLAAPGMLERSTALVELAMSAWERASGELVDPSDLEAARRFFARYTLRGASPGDEEKARLRRLPATSR